MDRTLANFIRALRNSEVRISTAETLDAFNTVELVGYRDRAFLKRSLSLVLSKTPDEKETYENCFDQFFSFSDVHGSRESAEGAADEGGAEAGEGEGGGESDGEGGQPQSGNQAGGKKSKSAAYGIEEEEEEDLGAGEMTEATSALGQLLMHNSKVELSVEMSKAGEQVDVRDIQVFTQKGLYTRRIMEEMGLPDLNREVSDLRDSSQVPRRRQGQ